MEESLLETPGSLEDSALKAEKRGTNSLERCSARKNLFLSVQSPWGESINNAE